MIKHGQLDIIVGTHALLGNKVVYNKLGLLVVDEEQVLSYLFFEFSSAVFYTFWNCIQSHELFLTHARLWMEIAGKHNFLSAKLYLAKF